MSPPPSANALELSGIHKSFDGFVALADAHFAARWGEVHALLGENGAGKSSLMNIAAGLYAPEAGELLVDGNAVRLAGPRDAARWRIGMVHQHFKLVSPFTVAENILLGLPTPPDDEPQGFRPRLARVRAEILTQARALGFEIDPDHRVDRLSVAEQQRVEILKVLLAGARILIMDEPTAVLTDQEAARLLGTVQRLARSGAAVVLVTHKMADVKQYADRVTVMRGGRTLATVDPRRTPESELVRMTVGEAPPPSPRAPTTRGAPRLVLQELTGGKTLDRLSMTVHAGEIYGLAGVGGNGQSELAEAIMGLLPIGRGTIELEGFGDLGKAGTVQRRALGIAAIPADRYGLALAGGLSVAENFGIGQVHADRYGRVTRLDRRRMEADAAEAVKAFDVLGVRSLRQKAALLSGGNAQKLVLAREFSRRPRLVLAHSPSRGLDVRAGAQVHERLRAARDGGAAVLLISEDLDEVMALADRIGVIVRGRIVAEFPVPADRQAIGQAMVAHA
ncbi:ABC transporter ATP-binding protein [Xylophilus sp. GOD-11R]|uniref:ABC transporter ATP-binding protein n=1 Tax=Xylophilus sp. GOD-11R TaxID=3089814 RepID=UPI00298D3B0D|nr:ABC transporter ATP-binding protein [Xylophilus sp. GOD-11R]WPB57433.1 ABC transporter ATP-binding protein [Xylophilus sp. GOD-11R]